MYVYLHIYIYIHHKSHIKVGNIINHPPNHHVCGCYEPIPSHGRSMAARVSHAAEAKEHGGVKGARAAGQSHLIFITSSRESGVKS